VPSLTRSADIKLNWRHSLRCYETRLRWTLMNQLAHNIVQEHDDFAEVIKARAEVALGALRGLPDEMRKQVLETALRDLPNSKLRITLGK
jgi:hypothetical protein